MLIIGCDFHTRYQQIAMRDEATGELVAWAVDHQSGEAHAFYRNLQGVPLRVGIEATGPTHWFERLLAELGHELWIGDAARIRASEVRKQKTDQRDALLILDLLLAKRFPKIWVPTPAERPPAVALALPQARKHAHDAGQPAARAGHEPGTLPSDQQTGQHHGALAADRSRAPRCATIFAAAALSALEIPSRTRGGESGHRGAS